MYNAIGDDGILNGRFVDSAGLGLNADDLKQSCAAQQEFTECSGGALVCILILGCNKRRTIKDHQFATLVTYRLTNAVVVFLLVLLSQLVRIGVILSAGGANAGF